MSGCACMGGLLDSHRTVQVTQASRDITRRICSEIELNLYNIFITLYLILTNSHDGYLFSGHKRAFLIPPPLQQLSLQQSPGFPQTFKVEHLIVQTREYTIQLQTVAFPYSSAKRRPRRSFLTLSYPQVLSTETRDKAKNSKQKFVREARLTYPSEAHSHIQIVRAISPPPERPKRHGRNRKGSSPRANFLLNRNIPLGEDSTKPTFADVLKVVETTKGTEEGKPLVRSPDMFDAPQSRWTSSGSAAGSLRRTGTDSSISTSNAANQPKPQPYIFAPKKTLEAKNQLRTIPSNEECEAMNNPWEMHAESSYPASNLKQQNAFQKNPHAYSQYMNALPPPRNLEAFRENRGNSYQIPEGAQLLRSPEIQRNFNKKELNNQYNTESSMNTTTESEYNQGESPMTPSENEDIRTVKPETLYYQTPVKSDYAAPAINHLGSTGRRGGFSVASPTEEGHTVFGLIPGGPARQRHESGNEKIIRKREEAQGLNRHMRKLSSRKSPLHRLAVLELNGLGRGEEFEAAFDEKMRALHFAQNNNGLPTIDGTGGFGQHTPAELRDQGFAQAFPTCASLGPSLPLYQNVDHLSDREYYSELNKFYAGNTRIDIPVLSPYEKMSLAGPGDSANPIQFPYPLRTNAPASESVFDGIANRLSYLSRGSGNGWAEVSGLSQYAPMKEVEREQEGMRRRMGLVTASQLRKQHQPILAGPRGRALVTPPQSPTPMGPRNTRYPPGLAPRPHVGFESQNSGKQRMNVLPAVPPPRMFSQFQQKKRYDQEEDEQSREKHYLGGLGFDV
ncbi:hypothetical protein EDC01DRAFT_756001 [Geopyxis carbonaria]|nr:hypothetical protein EDC01DRAFT_756001 [Geopyxis carbonaria]